MSRSGAKPVSGTGDAALYFDKAVQYLQAAIESEERKLFDPAVGNAVNAGILAADALSAARLGTVWSGDHNGGADHVATAGPEGKEVAKQLRRLLQLKNRAQYEAAHSTAGQAASALKAAARLVDAVKTALGD